MDTALCHRYDLAITNVPYLENTVFSKHYYLSRANCLRVTQVAFAYFISLSSQLRTSNYDYNVMVFGLAQESIRIEASLNTTAAAAAGYDAILFVSSLKPGDEGPEPIRIALRQAYQVKMQTKQKYNNNAEGSR